MCHGNCLLRVAKIDPGRAYLNGVSLTPNLNLGNEISDEASKT